MADCLKEISIVAVPRVPTEQIAQHQPQHRLSCANVFVLLMCTLAVLNGCNSRSESDLPATIKKALGERGVVFKSVIITPKGDCRLDLSDLSFSNTATLVGLPITQLDLSRTMVSELSGLPGLPLEILRLAETHVQDIGPLKGMLLKGLNITSTEVSDLSALKGMPLEMLCMNKLLAITDIRVLKGMPLRSLSIAETQVSDLSALSGMRLESLDVSYTPVSDLSSLNKDTLKDLSIAGTLVTDLSILKGCALTSLSVSPEAITNGWDVIRDMASLGNINGETASEFLRTYNGVASVHDAGQSEREAMLFTNVLLSKADMLHSLESIAADSERLSRVRQVFVPVSGADGRLVGYRLSTRGEEEICDLFRLQNGDVIKVINGIPATSRKRLEYWGKAILNGSVNEVVLLIEREGRTVRLLYQLSNASTKTRGDTQSIPADSPSLPPRPAL